MVGVVVFAERFVGLLVIIMYSLMAFFWQIVALNLDIILIAQTSVFTVSYRQLSRQGQRVTAGNEDAIGGRRRLEVEQYTDIDICCTANNTGVQLATNRNQRRRIAQWVDRGTKRPSAILTRDRILCASRDFSPSHPSVQTLLQFPCSRCVQSHGTNYAQVKTLQHW